MIPISVEMLSAALVGFGGVFAASLWRVLASFPSSESFRADPLDDGPGDVAARVLSDRVTPPRVRQDPRYLEIQRQIDAAALGKGPLPFVRGRPALPGRTIIPFDDDDEITAEVER